MRPDPCLTRKTGAQKPERPRPKGKAGKKWRCPQCNARFTTKELRQNFLKCTNCGFGEGFTNSWHWLDV